MRPFDRLRANGCWEKSVGNVTVIGGQWGDEGKGKIVDWLASRADMVVRFQGARHRRRR